MKVKLYLSPCQGLVKAWGPVESSPSTQEKEVFALLHEGLLAC